MHEGFIDQSVSPQATHRQVSTNGGPVIDQQPEPVQPAPSPPILSDTWPIRVKLLHKPVRNMRNELINELAFREPTGGDINRYGNPCRIDANGDIILEEVKMTRMMAALSGILLPNLEPMDPRDWNSCAYRLRNFFLPETAAW